VLEFRAVGHEEIRQTEARRSSRLRRSAVVVLTDVSRSRILKIESTRDLFSLGRMRRKLGRGKTDGVHHIKDAYSGS
jgi:hypothetical protein